MCTGFFSRMTSCDDWGEMKWRDLQLTLIGVYLHHWAPACTEVLPVVSSALCSFPGWTILIDLVTEKLSVQVLWQGIKGKYWGAASIGLRTDARQTHSLIKVMAEQPSKASCGCMECLSAHHISSVFRLNALTRSCFCIYLTRAKLSWHKEMQKGLCEYMHKDLQKQGSNSSSAFPLLKAIVIVPHAHLWKKSHFACFKAGA